VCVCVCVWLIDSLPETHLPFRGSGRYSSTSSPMNRVGSGCQVISHACMQLFDKKVHKVVILLTQQIGEEGKQFEKRAKVTVVRTAELQCRREHALHDECCSITQHFQLTNKHLGNHPSEVFVGLNKKKQVF